MASGKLNRNRQMWLLIVGCLILFGALLFVIPSMTFSLWWQILLVGAVSGVFTILGFQLWLARVLSRREGIVKLINRVTSGDLALSAQEIVTTTQSARMADSMRGLVTNLERTIRRFGQLASDVTRASEQISKRTRILSRSASDQLASTESTSASVTQIDQSINNVRQNMEELSANAEETSTSVLEMSASIEEVSRIADTLADFVDQTSTAIEEMIASINEVATNTESFSSFATQTAASMVQMNATTEEIRNSARQSAELSRYVTDAATEGRVAVTGTVDGMRKIQVSVEEAKSALADLAERSQEIGDIVRVIDDIAGQTNLLALNAAIIAAQAGERGRGFAVVADEIRDLSERTSVSTEEIRTLIQNVQYGVARAAEQMTAGADRVSDGVVLTERASQVLEKILDLTSRSTDSIAEIARGTEEQARGSQAAVTAIEEVTKMVQQTATATQQQSQTSRKIGEQASMVRDYTKHLKRAMSEQESGSRAISRAMENIMTLVQNVLESTSILASESSAIVKSMDVIKGGSREASFSVGDLSQMATTLNHESGLLRQELDRFDLPVPTRGGSLTTATVLWQQLTLDPGFAYASALVFMSKAIHAKLVKYGEGAELMPDLAERWEVIDQGLTYRFHLRRDARFHNGRPFEARDVYESFLRLLLPETKASGSWTLMNVVGAKDVAGGKTRELAGVVIQDPYTIDVHLEEPIAFFLSLLTMPETAIVPIEDARDLERFRLRGTGLGAFRVVEAVEGSRVRLVRHEDHFVEGEPFVDEITFRLDLRSFRDAAEAFVRGELDIVHGVPPRMASELKKESRFAPYLLRTVQSHTSYVGYDSSSAPFDRLEVRQAINHAIDRERINEQVYGGMNFVAQALLPPGILGYDPALRGYTHDPERARALLRTAGLGSGFEIEYRSWDSDEFRNSGLVDLLVEDLAAIGIRVNITMHSATDASKARQTRGHGLLYCANWYADFPDPDNFFYILLHSQGTSVRGLHFERAEIDARIMEGRRTADAEDRTNIYRDLNETVVREAPFAPLFHERLFVLHKPEIRGVRTSLVPPPVRYEQIWIEQE